MAEATRNGRSARPRLSTKETAAYFMRSYRAADGLWFVKTEESRGFDEALARDLAVWKVMPKIQARAVRALLGARGGFDGLQRCFREKLRVEGFSFSVKKERKRFTCVVKRCPWHELMRKSGRETLSDRVHALICTTDCKGWAKEFGKELSARLGRRICGGDTVCELIFEAERPGTAPGRG